MRHVGADALAAGVEGRCLFLCQRQLHDLLHAARADDAGHAREQAGLAVFAAELGAGGHDGLFVVQDEMRHARGRGRDAIFGTELAGERDPAAADGFLLQRVAVKAEARVLLCPDIERHAAEADAGPGRKLLIAVLAEHAAGDGFMVDAGLAGQGAEKPGRVEPRASAEGAAARQTEAQRQLPRDDIAGIGDVDEHAVKAAVFDLLCVAAHSGDGVVHLGQAVVRLIQQLDLAHAVDDHVARAEIREIACADRDPVRQIRCRVAQVLYLARELLRVFVDEDQLVRDALYRQRVRGVRAHMAKADHTKNSFFAHIQPILSS